MRRIRDEPHLAQAERAAKALKGVSGVEAVLLFGSVARGDDTDRSDIDVLVLIEAKSDALGVRKVVAAAEGPFAPVIHTSATLEQLQRDDWLFVKHLRDEGVVLFDRQGSVRRQLGDDPDEGAYATLMERSYVDLLRSYRDVDRFHGDLLFPFAAIYSLAKRITIEANARRNVFEFRRKAAFALYGSAAPQIADAIAELSRLEPFFEMTRLGERAVSLPFSSRGSETEFRSAAEAVERLVNAMARG